MALAAIALAMEVPAAASASEPAVISPVSISVFNPPHPVPGADNRNHLVYELQLLNLGSNRVTVDSVAPRARGRPFGPRLDGDRLRAAFCLAGGTCPQQTPSTTMPPGAGARIFMNVTFARARPAPQRLAHRFRLTFPDAQPPEPTSLSFVGVRTPVRQRKAIEIAPPVRGPRWLVGSGCCGVTPHRTATLPIDGTIHVPERFAIDFVQLDSEDRLYSGPPHELSSYAYFGARVRAVANGKVVRTKDGLPEQVPDPTGNPPASTPQTAGGNYVVEKIAPRHFAFYAHLQPGSLRVGKGDRVRRGQVLGLLGNSGSSNAPHLHFHVMDSPSPLESNGLPYTFSSFRGRGVVTDEAPLFDGNPAPIDQGALAGPHRHQLPMNDQLLDSG